MRAHTRTHGEGGKGRRKEELFGGRREKIKTF